MTTIGILLFDDVEELDVIVVPGGVGTRRDDDQVLVAWLADRADGPRG